MLQRLLSVEPREQHCQFLRSLLTYRKLSKMKTTYMKPLLDAAEVTALHSTTEVPRKAIFCSWNQTHVGTGRLSTSLPNLQSLPKGTHTFDDDGDDDIVELDDHDGPEGQAASPAEKEDAEDAEADGVGAGGHGAAPRFLHKINIRDSFVPSRSSAAFLSGDFNQMEMRIMAALSGDAQLVHFFTRDGHGDIYRFMAALCFDTTEEQVTKEQRACAKQLTVGILYGMVGGLITRGALHVAAAAHCAACVVCSLRVRAPITWLRS